MDHRSLAPSVIAAVAVVFPAAVSAASYAGSANPSAAVSGAVFGGFALFVLAVLAVSLGLFIFWIMMLVDCSRRVWPQKDVWLAILVVSFFLQLHWIAAFVYYFTVKRANVGSIPMSAFPQPPPAPPLPPVPPVV